MKDGNVADGTKGTGKAMSGGMKDQKLCVLVADLTGKEQELMHRFLTAWNFEPLMAASAAEAVELASQQFAAIAVIAETGPARQGLELVRTLRQVCGEMEIILLVEDDSPAYATEAFRAGVYDCLCRPVDFKQLSRDLNTLREAAQRRMERKVWAEAAGVEAGLAEMTGISAPMQSVFAAIRRLAREDAPVLITGLIGTGKELAAKALHALSQRASRPLLVYRCCGVSEELAVAELFGEQSASPETSVANPSEEGGGLLEAARGGTLLLDEIGDLPAAIQARLVPAVRHSGMSPTGEPAGRERSIRFLATSRLNLADRAGRGQFNGELYQLFSDNVIHLPSLHERQEDIPLLCRHFQEKFNQEFGKQTCGYSPAAERMLLSYHWPGNVRELENVVGRACLLADQTWIEQSDLSLPTFLSQRQWVERYAEWSDAWHAPEQRLDGTFAARMARNAARAGTRPASRK